MYFILKCLHESFENIMLDFLRLNNVRSDYKQRKKPTKIGKYVFVTVGNLSIYWIFI